MSSSRKKIAEAIKSIPEKKEKLRELFDSLQPYSSSLPSLALLQWKDLEDHFAAIEKSIDERFKALQDHPKGYGDGKGGEEEEDQPEDAKALSSMPEEEDQPEDAKALSSPPAAAASEADYEATPRPELRSFCANMDAKGLRSYIRDNQDDFVAITKELAPALRCAPDHSLLVLNAVKEFYPKSSHNSHSTRNGEECEILINRRTCIDLLEKLHLISPNISPCVRDRAKMLAIDWKPQIPKSGNFYLQALGFLLLIASYNIVADFPVDDVMHLFISVSRSKLSVDLLKNLGLTDKLPDIIQKQKSEGRQLDAVKFVYAFDMVDKYPPVPLLKAYIKLTEKRCAELRMKRHNALPAQLEAFSKEIDAVRSVLEVVEEYKLEAEYPRESLVKRVAELELSVKEVAQLKQQKADQNAASAAASNSNLQLLLQLNKRPGPSSSTSAAVIAANANPSLSQTHPWRGLADRAPYMGVAGTSGLAATGSVYNHGGLNVSGGAMGHGASHGRPRPYHPSESLVGTGSLYDRPVTCNGYTSSGLPPPYGSSPYP